MSLQCHIKLTDTRILSLSEAVNPTPITPHPSYTRLDVMIRTRGDVCFSNEYPTESMLRPSGPTNYDYDNTTHYANPSTIPPSPTTPTPALQQVSQQFLEVSHPTLSPG